MYADDEKRHNAHITLYIFSSINNGGLKICRLCSSLDRTDPLLNNNLSMITQNNVAAFLLDSISYLSGW